MGGISGGWNIPTPNKDHGEAKWWIKQAEYDYATLSTLNISSQHDEKTCAATCFMSHEVAEKLSRLVCMQNVEKLNFLAATRINETMKQLIDN